LATFKLAVNVIDELKIKNNSCGIARLSCDSTAFYDGEGFLGRGSELPPHHLGGLGESCKFPYRGPGKILNFVHLQDLKIASKQCKMMAFVK